ncbi:hypothetical protein MSKU3_1820 [Komagataeibacter oboediens]|nr:hypothetical protein MSKU3_1820 [Komagataeibacter oboediens]
MSCENLTREGLIWQIAKSIAETEGKWNGTGFMGGRTYILALFKAASDVVDEGLVTIAAARESA